MMCKKKVASKLNKRDSQGRGRNRLYPEKLNLGKLESPL